MKIRMLLALALGLLPLLWTAAADAQPVYRFDPNWPKLPLPNKWWMQGGGISGYTSILTFLKERARKECGVEVELEAIIGFFRTCAEDFAQSTTQLCFVGSAPYDGVSERLKYDDRHSAVRLLTLEDFGQLPQEQQHWYPMFCFEAALNSMP